ncbi:hypothetical protein CYLTODRAFT_492840 [Cylindrobasidium torrendii FP15055 ss-10]|uniref:Uncharacterized protein n=1 Tax=Cylindrobasidium torrendii FP15055 ss-10 TaxID=1314674 RepID=A0A0D7B2F4_9AGAR|nr:hypothetical protein CYLTODRAFT_492840 [Cylindrobasidium torrendii FP15055 ss-10]
MNTLHLENQVSFDFLFNQTRTKMLHSGGGTVSLISHQVASGLEPGEFTRRKKDAWNSLNVQRNLALSFDTGSMAFRPSDSVLKIIYSVYQHNTVCSVLENRIRLDETPVLSLPTKCSLEVDQSRHKRPIFTKHHHTGEIMRHMYPYATLPCFTLPLTDPGLLGIAAYTLDRNTVSYRDPCPFDLVQQFRSVWRTKELVEHSKVFYKKSRTPPPSPPRRRRGRQLKSHKRKHDDEGHARLSKRPRIDETASYPSPPRQRPQRDVANPATASASITRDILALKRKRAASQVQDCPVVHWQLVPVANKGLIAVKIPARTVYK